jgi:hypothetical protein
MAPLGDLNKSKIHSVFANRKFNKVFSTPKRRKIDGATPPVGLASSNVYSFFNRRKISRNLVRTETSQDCRTALLVWPHKVHSQG